MSDIERHASRVAAIVELVESTYDEPQRQQVFELLETIDHLHRSCVWRLFELMTDLGGKGFVERVVADPLVKTLFVLYDLIPTDPLQPVQSNVNVAPANGSAFIPLSSIGGRAPAWKVAFARADLPPGVLKAVEIDRVPVLLCALDDESRVVAYRNTCPGSALPLHLGSLAGGELHCPWHGCRFDPQTGKRLGSAGLDLEPLSVTVREGSVYVALTSSAQPVTHP